MSKYEPGTVVESVAVFPLPGAVLFPGSAIPLHIFEPRYRAMTRDVINGSGELALATVPDPGALDEHGNPGFSRIAGLGIVTHHRELPDGRFHILVRGVGRAELDELPFVPPYRKARATVLASGGSPSQSDMSALMSAATRFAARITAREPRFELELPDGDDAARIIDACAASLVIESEDRQRLLEELSSAKRARELTALLAVQEALLRDDDEPESGMLN